ncbi:DUF72 domain-containing protein [Chitinispirillales bacterium ANBcel5]|uniref:DUF72 domain-containing protein n=1 Tax=Cellulosispirillum alkaliphilum TaxID=3039283 RepID=UPI002A542C51|nr:DUF72 domain-containing protein [Chitinispirillales bacterium ANBcel5]
MAEQKSRIKRGKVLLGTSGWTYEHWKERFYPPKLAKTRWFEYFAAHFDTVELNASFYRIPTQKATKSWNARSPQNFRFSIKMSRLITHIKKLQNCENELQWFFSVFEPLQEKISVYLIQLPPNLKFDLQRLDNFLQQLPPHNRYALEFRNPAWYDNQTYQLLRSYDAIFCIHDMEGMKTERVITSSDVYLRFHGHQALYGGDYPDEELERWAGWIASLSREGKGVMGYFNNDLEGYAVKNCTHLKELVAKRL